MRARYYDLWPVLVVIVRITHPHNVIFQVHTSAVTLRRRLLFLREIRISLAQVDYHRATRINMLTTVALNTTNWSRDHLALFVSKLLEHYLALRRTQALFQELRCRPRGNALGLELQLSNYDRVAHIRFRTQLPSLIQHHLTRLTIFVNVVNNMNDRVDRHLSSVRVKLNRYVVSLRSSIALVSGTYRLFHHFHHRLQRQVALRG